MKEIRVETIKVSELKKNFGNPRKIKKVKKDELERSLEEYGDFGLILIDENNNIIAIVIENIFLIFLLLTLILSTSFLII